MKILKKEKGANTILKLFIEALEMFFKDEDINHLNERLSNIISK
jgi:hypothetical protein